MYLSASIQNTTTPCPLIPLAFHSIFLYFQTYTTTTTTVPRFGQERSIRYSVENFRHYRGVEVKHGRIAMAATRYARATNDSKGSLGPSGNLDFKDGLAAECRSLGGMEYKWPS
jgi:hypothetical protein